jgi:hypothetical protein
MPEHEHEGHVEAIPGSEWNVAVAATGERMMVLLIKPDGSQIDGTSLTAHDARAFGERVMAAAHKAKAP